MEIQLNSFLVDIIDKIFHKKGVSLRMVELINKNQSNSYFMFAPSD